jgi:GDP/UDP-N,N'-diacetylbacillosamine 2-epimerase (hydrolysing)
MGNSSSGLTEAPSFGIPTVDIGDRQKGRIKATSVIHCEPKKEELKDAIKIALSKDFRKKATSTSNPYGVGGASKKIAGELIGLDLNNIIKKEFYDL